MSDLLRVAAQLRTQWTDFQLLIAGDGPQRADLETQLRALRLEDCGSIVGEPV